MFGVIIIVIVILLVIFNDLFTVIKLSGTGQVSSAAPSGKRVKFSEYPLK